MDPIVVIVLIVAFFIFVIAQSGGRGRAVSRGLHGELKVDRELASALDESEYRRFHDLVLPSGMDETQIDHVVVSPYGVFVIETKNYSGWIFGGERSKVWTQTIWGNKSKFQNPLRQNYKHTKAIESFLSLGSKSVFSVVVFVGSGEFRTSMPPNVLYLDELCTFVRSKTKPLLGKGKYLWTIDRLERLQEGLPIPPNEPRDFKIVNPYPSCPICGEKMVVRKAQRGKKTGQEFHGCSNFPKCRGTRAI